MQQQNGKELRPYNREHAVQYARRWALGRNPLFYNFKGIGGDCTNYISQCVYAGTCAMNFTKTFGWYYFSSDDRAPAWSGVQYLYNFLTGNRGPGPVCEETGLEGLLPGDLIQLGRDDGSFFHTLIITDKDRGGYLVCAHTHDSLDRRLNSYQYQQIRGIHILGCRQGSPGCNCFTSLYDGSKLVIC